MSKGRNLTIVERLLKSKQIKYFHVAKVLNITPKRFEQMCKENFFYMKIEYLYKIASLLEISPIVLLHIINYNNITPQIEQKDLQKDIEEKAKNILNSL